VTSGNGHVGLAVALVAFVFVVMAFVIWRQRRAVSPASGLNLTTTGIRDVARGRESAAAAPGGA
jgi:hypothetical protein